METIGEKAEKEHSAALEDILNSVVENVDEVLSENISVESCIYMNISKRKD